LQSACKNSLFIVSWFTILIFLVQLGQIQANAEVLGKKHIFAFLYLPKNKKPVTLHSANLILSKPGDWKYWRERGVITCQGKTWFSLLRNPVSEAVKILASIDYGGNPEPVVCIDEFGFDFGGQTDQKTALILRETRKKSPQLRLVVWHMRGPISPVLAEAYREVVDLVLPEAYVGSMEGYWHIISQVRAAQYQGLMHKTIVGLGLGIGGNPGDKWAATKKELEQQIRFLRLIAPESPGVAFFAAGVNRGEPGLLAYADELCNRFDQIPTDGSGLPREVIELYKTFTEPWKRPMIVASSRWVEPDRSWSNPSRLVVPKTMRVLLMNLGEKDATNIKLQLRNPKEKGGDVFARGTVNVPGKSVAVAVLPVTARWKSWKTWQVGVVCEGCKVFVFPETKENLDLSAASTEGKLHSTVY